MQELLPRPRYFIGSRVLSITGINSQLACEETVTSAKPTDAQAPPKPTHFVQITDLPVNERNVVDTSKTGRLRWKIENESFNTLKNGGYGMAMRHAIKSYTALKNYFQFMQMAHMIHQLMSLNTRFQQDIMTGKNHPTLKILWFELIAAMQWTELDEQELERINGTRRQFRFNIR